MKWHTVEARKTADTPHGYLFFADEETSPTRLEWNDDREEELREYRKDRTHKNMAFQLPFRSSAINVKSSGPDERIVYWTGDLDPEHPVVQKLAELDDADAPRKFYEISNRSGQSSTDLIGLDFIRDRIVRLEDGTIRPWNGVGKDDDIIDAWDAFFAAAEPYADTELFLFGELFLPKKDGVHNIHMNQGNSGSWRREDGIHQDGGVIIRNGRKEWKYFFCGFASQASETDDVHGHATTETTLADVASGTGA